MSNFIEDKGYNADQLRVLSLLKGEEEVCLMVAPSFVIDFDYGTFVPLMKALGFEYTTELTFGAKIVNQKYHKYIYENKNKQEKFISSVCPASVALIKSQYPQMLKYLLPFDSPMGAMAKVIDKNWPNQKNVFLAPCFAKKTEAKKYPNLIHATVTFSEMKEIIAKEKIKPKKGEHLFDRFYNDYTKIYPLSGGLSATLHSKDILKKEEIVSCDGCKNLQKLFDKHGDEKFYDILFCNGGCIGGPGVASNSPLFVKRKKVLNYRKNAKSEKIGERKGLDEYTKGIDFSVNH